MDTPQNDLISAIEKGNSPAIRNAINRGASLDTPNESGMLPLHRAVMKNDPRITLTLLQQGADPNQREECTGQSPLEISAKNNSIEITKALIKFGGDPQIRTPIDMDASQPTIEQIARRNGHIKLAEEIRRLSQPDTGQSQTP